MRRATWGFLFVVLAASPAISYFKYDRQIGTAGASGQHYAAVDETIWEHALPGLYDMRLYAAGKEIPYARITMRSRRETEQRTVRLLEPGTLGGKTLFLLDMEGISEYDRITLTLRARNYVAHARVEGQDDPHGTQWADLGTTTLFDLSDEKLGHNSTLQIPVSTYKYLRVTVDGLVKPSDVQSVTAGIERAQEAVWRDLSSEPVQTQEGKDTVLSFAVPENIPVERVMLAIDPAQGNLDRGIEVQSDKGSMIGVGEISRIHIQRNEGRIDVDQTWLSVSAESHGHLRTIIHNGDDTPLRITWARLQQYERRLYFDCDAGASLELFYGDQKLSAPVYDYAKLFQIDPSAGQLHLSAEEANASYTGRPDDRPWSERHPAVLWTAILAAVALLGRIAVRSIKTAGT
jgi:hypothetical protein